MSAYAVWIGLNLAAGAAMALDSWLEPQQKTANRKAA